MQEQLLNTGLLDLQKKLHAVGIDLVLGGGFGLYLQQLNLLSQETIETLLPVESWPKPRSTSDLDLFFPLKVIVNLSDMQKVRSILDELKFNPIAGSEYWQFIMPETSVKIDLLCGPIEEDMQKELKMDRSDNRRVRPKGELKLHARHTPEAIALNKYLQLITISGKLSNGEKYSTKLSIPSSFTYLLMKLTAFGDQARNNEKDFGRHHALDIYRIIAMLTESQYTQTKQQFKDNMASPYVQRVCDLVKEFFISDTSLGILRIREHNFYGDNMDLSAFRDTLNSLILD